MVDHNRYHFTSAGATHPGCVRDVNQDAFLADPETGLWVVADGVGGHAHGDTGSRLLVDTIKAALPPQSQSLAETVRHAMLDANRQLVAMASQIGPATVIGSTVAALIAQAQQCICLWAGDSRIYGLRRHKLSRLTRDHSEVEEMVAHGSLAAADSLQHPNANIISRAVGQHNNLEIDGCMYDLYPSDRLLLCTDGLTKELADQEIETMLQQDSCRQACDNLMNLALERGCHDNITIVIVDIHA